MVDILSDIFLNRSSTPWKVELANGRDPAGDRHGRRQPGRNTSTISPDAISGGRISGALDPGHTRQRLPLQCRNHPAFFPSALPAGAHRHRRRRKTSNMIGSWIWSGRPLRREVGKRFPRTRAAPRPLLVDSPAATSSRFTSAWGPWAFRCSIAGVRILGSHHPGRQHEFTAFLRGAGEARPGLRGLLVHLRPRGHGHVRRLSGRQPPQALEAVGWWPRKSRN